MSRPPLRPSPPPPAGGFPFRLDLHVHTARYSPCAELMAPREIGPRALDRGLHGVVLTDHDVMWTEEELAYLQEETPEVRFFRGIECTAASSHVLAVGMDDAALLEKKLPEDELVRRIHAGGGVAILAHPYRTGDPEADGLPLDAFDAIEIASTSFSEEESVRSIVLANRLNKPKVASSDAHALAVLAHAWTELPRAPLDERDLAAMLRTGLGRPVVRRPTRAT